MKVLHFINSRDSGGAETLILDLCDQLNNIDGINNCVMAFPDSWIFEQCGKRNIERVSVPSPKYWSLKTLPFFVASLSKWINTNKIDVVHTHLFGAIIRGGLTSPFTKIPVIATLHDTIHIEESHSKAKVLYFLNKCLDVQFVAISENVKSLHESLGGCNKIDVILNGVNTKKFAKKYCPHLKSEIGIPEDHVVVFSAGRLAKEKNFLLLLEAVENIQASKPYTVLIAGTGEQENMLRTEVETRGLSKRVVFLGHRNDIPDLMSMADVYVSTSQQEGLGISIQEAMTTSLPVVATNVGGVNELIVHGETGMLVNSFSLKILREHLSTLIDNSLLRTTLGTNAFNHARQHFSIKSTAEQYLHLYQKLDCR